MVWCKYPRCSMYGIFTNIDPINDPNVGTYSIHGACGNWCNVLAPSTARTLVSRALLSPLALCKASRTPRRYPWCRVHNGDATGADPGSRPYSRTQEKHHAYWWSFIITLECSNMSYIRSKSHKQIENMFWRLFRPECHHRTRTLATCLTVRKPSSNSNDNSKSSNKAQEHNNKQFRNQLLTRIKTHLA